MNSGELDSLKRKEEFWKGCWKFASKDAGAMCFAQFMNKMIKEENLLSENESSREMHNTIAGLFQANPIPLK